MTTIVKKKTAPHSDSTILEPKGQFSFPKGIGVFPVLGDCMEPMILDGQMVFAVRQELGPVAADTPVIIHTAEKSFGKVVGWHPGR